MPAAPPPFPAHAFTDVDAQDDAARLVHCLDLLQTEPFYAGYKARTYELLAARRGHLVLDLGGGTGDDARAIEQATGARVTLADSSQTMAAEAKRRGLERVLRADGYRLPFPSSTFDAVRADRVLQHVLEPLAVLGEMIRVTRAGGRVVVVDPDYATQVVDVDDHQLARRVLGFRADVMLRHGTQAHRMPGLFGLAGLVNVLVEPMTLVVRNPEAVDGVMGLWTWAATAAERGALSAGDAERWPRLLDAAVNSGRFLYAVTFFITAGELADNPR
jgi:SAM-dependent methyltransferase